MFFLEFFCHVVLIELNQSFKNRLVRFVLKKRKRFRGFKAIRKNLWAVSLKNLSAVYVRLWLGRILGFRISKNKSDPDYAK